MSIGDIIFVFFVYNAYATFCIAVVDIFGDGLGYNLDEWLERKNEYGITYVTRVVLFFELSPILTVVGSLYAFVFVGIPSAWEYLTTKR